MKKIKNHAVIITGALGGIGKTLCEVLKEKGFHVIGIDRKKNVSKTDYPVIRYDISTISLPDNQEELKTLIYAELGNNAIKSIINNAAIQIVRNTAEITWDDWARTFGTNVFAPFFIIRMFLEELKKCRGSVINMASIHARLTKKDFTAYSTSKGALVSLTRAMALDLAPDVRVNAIMPAATDTPMLREGFKENPEGFTLLEEYHPLKRIADPKEIATTASFLISDDSSFITGSTIWVDGGIGGVLNDPVFAR